ncbi:MAG: IclR family transcriptional regulator [Lachnospiraceae bacterium]|nr:IclR family transcriptional regulator [Lachnospiraceae bacterium]
MATSNEHRSTTRVLDALELIAQGGKSGYTLTEICQQLDVAKSSMLPILHTLVHRHYLSTDSVSGKYTIGSYAFQIGNAYLENFDTMSEITKELHNITNVCSETSYFATLKDGEAFYIAKADSSESIRMVAAIGHSLPAYSTGIGKALLTDYSLADLKKLYPQGLRSLTPKTITDFNELAAQLKKSRSCGFSCEIEESTQYIRCLAVPLRKNGTVIAAISVAIPVFRYTSEKEDLILHLLENSKQRLEHIFQSINVNFDIIG